MTHTTTTLLLFFHTIHLTTTNYITNGGFALPTLAASVLNGKLIDSWNVSLIDLKNQAPYMGFGQYVDMQKGISQNGWIEQYIQLPYNGTYELNFYQRAKTANYSLYQLEIYWNGVHQATQIANTTNITYESLIFVGVAGTNILKFQETGLDVDNHGMNIDQVSLNLVTPWFNNVTNSSSNSSSLNNTTNNTNSTNPTNTTNNTNSTPTTNTTTNTTNGTIINPPFPLNLTQNNTNLLLPAEDLYYISVIMSIFFNHAVSIRYSFLLLEDLWLYSYDDRSYDGVIKDVFNTTAFIQELKFQVLEKWLGWMKYLNNIQISDYRSYSKNSMKKSSQILLEVIFPYFIYTFPQTICLCVALFLAFHILKTTKYGPFFRRYSFFWSNLIQTLLQGNIAYFTFITLGHLSLGFSFNFWDKAALIFTVVFFLFVILFACLFYFVMGSSLKMSAGYFISCLYRCMPSYAFLTVNNLLKGVLRGSIFYLLSSQYQKQIIFLCIIQVLLIMSVIWVQKVYKIFMTKCMFSLYLVYQGTFVVLNLCLYGDYQTNGQENDIQLNNLFLQLEAILIYLLVGITVLRMVMDLVPLDKFKKKSQGKEKKETSTIKNTEQKKKLIKAQPNIFDDNDVQIKIQTNMHQIIKINLPGENMEIQVNSNLQRKAESNENSLKININCNTNFVQNKSSNLMPGNKKNGVQRVPTNLRNPKDVFTRLVISNTETK